MSGGPNGNFLRLANAGIGNQQNEIAFGLTDPGLAQSIKATFAFRMGGGTRADGFGFALLNTAVFGVSGATPHFLSEEPSLPATVGVGIDIYCAGGAGPFFLAWRIRSPLA